MTIRFRVASTVRRPKLGLGFVTLIDASEVQVARPPGSGAFLVWPVPLNTLGGYRTGQDFDVTVTPCQAPAE